jgi:hypothetical protein
MLSEHQQAIAYVVEACADQTRLISGSLGLPEGVSYPIDALFRGGGGALKLAANGKYLSAGSRLLMVGLMVEESSIYKTINETIWRSQRSSTFGPVV